MAVANVTMTGPVGPGKTMTANVFNDVREFQVIPNDELIRLTLQDGKVVDLDYETIATLTWSISGETATVTIST